MRYRLIDLGLEALAIAGAVAAIGFWKPLLYGGWPSLWWLP